MTSLTIMLKNVDTVGTMRAVVGKIYSMRQTDAHGLGLREDSAFKFQTLTFTMGHPPIGPKLIMYTISLGDSINYRGKGSLPHGSMRFMALNTDCSRTYT